MWCGGCDGGEGGAVIGVSGRWRGQSLAFFIGSLVQGCLAPVDIRIPASCILSPSPTAAVVGGNVLTSQRVVDVLLKAFGVHSAHSTHSLRVLWADTRLNARAGAAAASQGCMNNFTFGDERMGYYETIAGVQADFVGVGGIGDHSHSQLPLHARAPVCTIFSSRLLCLHLMIRTLPQAALVRVRVGMAALAFIRT